MVALSAIGSISKYLIKNDSLVAVLQDAVFGEPFHGVGQHHAFDVAADGGNRLGAHGVVDPLDVLLDDGAFIEVAGDEMGSGADQLDAPLVRLGIGPRALETGQEGMVDIDGAAP